MASVSKDLEVTPNQAAKALKKAFSIKLPVFMWGSPGIGKSDIIAQLGVELDAHVIDVRLATNDSTDIKGIPVPDRESKTMVWFPSGEFPTAEFASKYKTIILFLDEMNSSTPSVMAAAYQLILNRRVGEYVLPDNVVVVAAGNKASDKGVVYRMPSPLANRFAHLFLRSDFDDWLNWATKNNIHESVVGYLYKNTHELNTFDPKNNDIAIATPRSWSSVSKICYDDEVDSYTMRILISGLIGDGLAAKFMAYKELTCNLPDPMDILTGKVTKLESGVQISAMYSLVISLCYRLKEQFGNQDPSHGLNNSPEIDAMCELFTKFMMDNFQDELVILGMRTSLRSYGLNIPLTSKSSIMLEFEERFSKLLGCAGNPDSVVKK